MLSQPSGANTRTLRMSVLWCSVHYRWPTEVETAQVRDPNDITVGVEQRGGGLCWLSCNYVLCKALYPFHLCPKHCWFPLPESPQFHSGPDFCLTRFCSTRLFTHTVDPCSSCLCSTEPLSGESMLSRERLQRNGSRNTFLLNTPCQLGTVEN